MIAKVAKLSPLPSGPLTKRLTKGELIFAEGENSRAMYLLKTGIIRIFKKKGDSQIELDTIRAGQILGELAFLDGNPRSASGEALVDCELVEISSQSFQQEMAKTPEWLKILLKTIVSRLRAASTRIRQLESVTMSVDYSDRSGKRSASVYTYLSGTDITRTMAAILLVGLRGQPTAGGVELSTEKITRIAHEIMGVPSAKVTSLIEVLICSGLLTRAENTIVLTRVEFAEELLAYFNQENLAEPAKRHDLPPRAFLLMGLISKHIGKFQKDSKTGLTHVNLSEIRKWETTPERKEPFRLDDLAPLVAVGYCTNIGAQSQAELMTQIDENLFLKHYRFQRVAMGILAVNEQKRK